MSGKLTLPRVMTCGSIVPPDMNSILDPLLAIFAIVVPLALAYVVLLWQAHNPACDYRKEYAITCDDLRQGEMSLSRADEKYGAR